MPSIGHTQVLASIGAVVEMGVLSTLKQLLMESMQSLESHAEEEWSWSERKLIREPYSRLA
jgi:hypothetical protein